MTGQPAPDRAQFAGEARFRAVVDGFSDPILIIDAYETVRYVNSVFLQAFGYILADVIGTPFADLLPVDDRSGVTAILAGHQPASGRALRFEHGLVTRDGTTERVETSANILSDPSGLRTTILHLCVITERKRAEEALRASEESYRQLIENSHDLIQRIAPDGRILFVNSTWLETLGYSEADLPTLTLADILHPDSLATCRRHIAALWQHHDSGVLHLTLQTHRGATVEVVGVAALQLEGGRPVATNLFFRDVTEQRRSIRVQAARLAFTRILADSPALELALAQVLEAIAANLGWQAAELWMPDRSGQRLRWHNHWHSAGHPELDVFVAASHDFSFARGEGLPGRAWAAGTVIWEDDLATSPTFQRARLARSAGLRSAVAVPIVRGHEALGVMLFFSRTPRPIEAALEAVLSDLGAQLGQLAARKEAERALEAERASLARRVEERTADLSRLNGDLARAVRVKDEFLATMSHELRTPLNTILALSEVLLEQIRGPLNEKQLASIHSIEASGQHLLALINDILDLSKVEAGRLELVREPLLVRDVCQMSLMFVKELALKKQLRLTFQLNDQQARLEADTKRLKQMLVNLLSNAVKFTPLGGSVSLEVEARPEAGHIHFAVSDTGIGISREGQARLFQPFTQLESHLQRQHEGTGLGLALVRRLAELHNGSVAVKSEPGQGSCFTITLPFRALQSQEHEQLPGDAPTKAPSPAPAVARARVLLADDHPGNIEVLVDYLQDRGYLVLVAQNGREALERAAEARPDLILLDIQMPEIDGLEVTRRLRADPRFAATPIIAVTALAMPGDRERCLAAGASEYITKPFSLRLLGELIQRLLGA